jgi:hypothetical protein
MFIGLKANFDGPDLFYLQPEENTIWKLCILTVQQECQIIKPPFDEFQEIHLYNNLVFQNMDYKKRY